ncbi:hypothetical protein [Ligilactobacillus acidipiscis]|uniref:hypothetical protein n=1 Tax=Ligilactobacillus acidipiscis TaxID=89059 RepID=UPI0023F7626E|nr:hypothetical protein [Ligilactobacillus acidipiscis]WEV56683.1 hypothetical protein OZX66_10730 [Ligilactobacillus acidipiscis]
MDKDRKIFHETFYQEAQKKFTDAYNDAEWKLKQGVYDKAVIQQDLDKTEKEIRDMFSTGFHEFAERTKAKMNNTIKNYVDQIEQNQQNNGTSELIRRQNLESKLGNFDIDELHQFITKQLDQEFVPDFDMSVIKKASEGFDNPELKTDLSLLRHKLPREAAKNSKEYQSLEHDLHQASFTSQDSIFLKDNKGEYESASVAGTFHDLMKSQND